VGCCFLKHCRFAAKKGGDFAASPQRKTGTSPIMTCPCLPLKTTLSEHVPQFPQKVQEAVSMFVQNVTRRQVRHLQLDNCAGVKEYIAYDFTGNPTGKKHIHSATGKMTQTEIYVNTYDQAERLTKTTHQLNGGTAVTFAENSYDELGRLKTNKKGGQSNLNATYAYNIRSWIKSITTPLYAETLYYNESYGGSAKCYGGNLSAKTWKIVSETNTRGYAYTYDNLSRLTAANYLENAVASANYKTAYTYDKMSNILTLQRYGKTTATLSMQPTGWNPGCRCQYSTCRIGGFQELQQCGYRIYLQCQWRNDKRFKQRHFGYSI